MKRIEPIGEPPKSSRARTVFLGLAGAALFLLLIGMILIGPSRSTFDAPRNRLSSDTLEPSTHSKSSTREKSPRWKRSASSATTSQTAEEIVATKVSQFGKKRRELVHAMARKFNVEVPGDVERFFAAVENGRWEEIDAAHEALLEPGKGLNQPRSAE